MKFVDVSVLMSVYYREKPQNFSESLESMITQTNVPKQFVIVKDGRLGIELNRVLNSFLRKYNDIISIDLVELDQLVSLGVALNAGLKACEYPLVARMDSDDHSLPKRIEKQTTFLNENPNVMVLGGNIQEFTQTWSRPISYRKVPTESNQIFKFSRLRNPLNHMTVMFRRDFILNEMHGYREVPGFEDFDLWLRVLKENDAAILNLPQVLVAARTSSLQERRGGLGYVKQNAAARVRFYKDKLISSTAFCLSLVLGTVAGFSSNGIRQFLYQKFLRSDNVDHN